MRLAQLVLLLLALGPAAREAGAGDTPLTAKPRALPTIAAIDWKAFFDPQDKAFGHSGRTIALKPGKPGTIARALRRARAGDTLLLAGGTYREGLEDDHRALRLLRDGLVIRARPGQRARIVPRSPEVNAGVIVAANHVLLQGLEIAGFGSVGIALDKEGQTLHDVAILDVVVTMPADGKDHDGIVVYTDNRAKKRPASDGLLLRDVRVTGASLSISCNAGPCRNWYLERVSVVGGRGEGSGADAIAVEHGDNIVLHRVEVSRASADGIDLKARRVLVSACRAHHLGRNGIKLWHGGDIVNSIVHHTGADAAVVFLGAGHYRVLNSVVAFHNYPRPSSYNLTAGYDSREALRVELINSIFYKTSGGMFFQDGTRVTIARSIFFGMANGQLLRAQTDSGEVELELAQGAGAVKRHGLGSVILADPAFVAPARGDFRLRPGSPGIDRGAQVKRGFPARDIAGAPRSRGKAPDIGAHER